MVTDRARRTFDATRQYRAVVWQQGRVTVEADANEAEEIRADESRKNLIDVIGPAGTPDDGYRVSVPAVPGKPVDFDFSVGPGTMYVGGLRTELAQPSGWRAQAQSDWLDMPPDTPTTNPGSELVLLWLQAAEVSAVEDAALREPALGGPDTAARLRLLRRILRIPFAAGDCNAGLAAAVTGWEGAGSSFDAATRRVLSNARLQVSFKPDAGEATPCEPAAQSGYLGADNQLLRVQLVEDPTTLAVDHLVWGPDNASFLYRVTRVGTSMQELKLGSLPVDEDHWPRAGRAVEVLRATARLEGGEYVAAPHGFTTTLATTWDPNTETLQLAADLPEAYLDAPQLFLRVWQAKLEIRPGDPIALGDTGVRVTLSNGPLVAGDHWLIGVRPGVPQAVFPERLLSAPQPPDGPQRWATPLAVLRWTSRTSAEVSDCRPPFDDLVELTARRQGCCTIRLTPADLRRDTLQNIIDRAVLQSEGGVVICLAPGRYELPAPLRLGARHAGLTLEGCGGNVVIAAAEKAVAAFSDGLVVLRHSSHVTLRGLRFSVPLVPFDFRRLQVGDEMRRRLRAALDQLVYVSVGLQAIAVEGLRIDDCDLQFTQLSHQGLVVATGLRLVGGARATQIERTRFTVPARSPGEEGQLPIFCCGVFGAPMLSLEQPSLVGPGDPQRAQAVVGLIDGVTLRGCRFEGCFTALWLGGPLGELRIEDNTVRGSVLGLMLVNSGARMTGATLESDSSTPSPAASETPWWRVFAETQRSLYRDGSVVLAETLQRMASPLGELDTEPLALRFHPAEVDQAERAAWQQVIDSVAAETRPSSSQTEPPRGVESGVSAATLPGDLSSELADTLARLDRVLADAKTPGATPLRLYAAGNDIQTFGGAFWLLNGLSTPTGEIVICGNRLKASFFLLPVLLAAFVRRGTVTGNVITNDAPDLVIPRPDGAPITIQSYGATIMQGAPERTSVAVTGNAFVGWYWLPLRNDFPAPLNIWYPLNAGWFFPLVLTP